MTSKQLGEFVKEQRILQNLTQQELADKAGFKRRQVILEIENDQCDYGISVMLRVLDALGFVLMPTINGKKQERLLLGGKALFNFKEIEVADPEDDPNLQEKKKKRIFAQQKNK